MSVNFERSFDNRIELSNQIYVRRMSEPFRDRGMKPTSSRSSRSISVPSGIRGHASNFHDVCISKPKPDINEEFHKRRQKITIPDLKNAKERKYCNFNTVFLSLLQNEGTPDLKVELGEEKSVPVYETDFIAFKRPENDYPEQNTTQRYNTAIALNEDPLVSKAAVNSEKDNITPVLAKVLVAICLALISVKKEQRELSTYEDVVITSQYQRSIGIQTESDFLMKQELRSVEEVHNTTESKEIVFETSDDSDVRSRYSRFDSSKLSFYRPRRKRHYRPPKVHQHHNTDFNSSVHVSMDDIGQNGKKKYNARYITKKKQVKMPIYENIATTSRYPKSIIIHYKTESTDLCMKGESQYRTERMTEKLNLGSPTVYGKQISEESNIKKSEAQNRLISSAEVLNTKELQDNTTESKENFFETSDDSDGRNRYSRFDSSKLSFYRPRRKRHCRPSTVHHHHNTDFNYSINASMDDIGQNGKKKYNARYVTKKKQVKMPLHENIATTSRFPKSVIHNQTESTALCMKGESQYRTERMTEKLNLSSPTVSAKQISEESNITKSGAQNRLTSSAEVLSCCTTHVVTKHTDNQTESTHLQMKEKEGSRSKIDQINENLTLHEHPDCFKRCSENNTTEEAKKQGDNLQDGSSGASAEKTSITDLMTPPVVVTVEVHSAEQVEGPIYDTCNDVKVDLQDRFDRPNPSPPALPPKNRKNKIECNSERHYGPLKVRNYFKTYFKSLTHRASMEDIDQNGKHKYKALYINKKKQGEIPVNENVATPSRFPESVDNQEPDLHVKEAPRNKNEQMPETLNIRTSTGFGKSTSEKIEIEKAGAPNRLITSAEIHSTKELQDPISEISNEVKLEDLHKLDGQHLSRLSFYRRHRRKHISPSLVVRSYKIEYSNPIDDGASTGDIGQKGKQDENALNSTEKVQRQKTLEEMVATTYPPPKSIDNQTESTDLNLKGESRNKIKRLPEKLNLSSPPSPVKRIVDKSKIEKVVASNIFTSAEVHNAKELQETIPKLNDEVTSDDRPQIDRPNISRLSFYRRRRRKHISPSLVVRSYKIEYSDPIDDVPSTGNTDQQRKQEENALNSAEKVQKKMSLDEKMATTSSIKHTDNQTESTHLEIKEKEGSRSKIEQINGNLTLHEHPNCSKRCNETSTTEEAKKQGANLQDGSSGASAEKTSKSDLMTPPVLVTGEVHSAEQVEVPIYETCNDVKVDHKDRFDRSNPSPPPLPPKNRKNIIESNCESEHKPKTVNSVESGTSIGVFKTMFQKISCPFSKCKTQDESYKFQEVFDILKLERDYIERMKKIQELKRYQQEKQGTFEKWVADHTNLFKLPAYIRRNAVYSVVRKFKDTS